MHILGIIFDWVFPPSGEEMDVRSLTTTKIRSFYDHKLIKNIEILSQYKNPHVRSLVHEAKFHNNSRAHTLLCALLQKHLDKNEFKYDVIVPIPLSKKRFRSRGHNQVLSVLSNIKLNERTNLEINILSRKRNTRPQTELLRKNRIDNMHDAFKVSKPELINGKRVLIVDDVMTTGATLNAAKASLLQHSPTTVTCLALAH